MIWYDDTATFTQVTGGGYDPESGLPTSGTSVVVNLTGRYDTNVKRFIQRGEDGNYTAPSFVFYMPLSTPVVPLDVELSVFDSTSGQTYKGVVTQFNKGRLNAYVLCQ